MPAYDLKKAFVSYWSFSFEILLTPVIGPKTNWEKKLGGATAPMGTGTEPRSPKPAVPELGHPDPVVTGEPRTDRGKTWR